MLDVRCQVLGERLSGERVKRRLQKALTKKKRHFEKRRKQSYPFYSLYPDILKREESGAPSSPSLPFLTSLPKKKTFF